MRVGLRPVVRQLRRASTLASSPLTAYRAAVASGELQEDEHQLAAIDQLEALYGALLTWRPPPPPPPPPPPKESKWKGPQMDAYGEPIGGGTFYTGVKNEEQPGSGLWTRLSTMLGGGGDDNGEGKEPELAADVDAPRGVYLFGGTGCGKTMMVDRFLAPAVVPPAGAAPTWVRRVHLHEFMIEVHQRAHRLRQETPAMGDPVPYLAYELTCETQVLLLDEVSVTDVADALMLRKLFRRLFHAGIVVVATSNRAPAELYLNGLQRASFLPFIADLEARCHVHRLGSTTDYRHLASAASGVARLSPDGTGAYLHPLNLVTASAFAALWARLTAADADTGPRALPLKGRSLPVPLASDAARAARFSYTSLIAQPLGPADYLTLARVFGTVFVEGVPQLTLSQSTEVRRLITLVDTCYDAGTLLVLSAAVPLDELFLRTGADVHADKFGDVIGNIVQTSQDEGFAFTRTVSRLREMQSVAYVRRSGSAALLVEHGAAGGGGRGDDRPSLQL